MDCMAFDFFAMFGNEAAEIECFYINNRLKKYNRVPFQQFMHRIQQLNSYLDLLPCLYYSECATKLTKVMKLFDDANIASHILQTIPRYWQDRLSTQTARII